MLNGSVTVPNRTVLRPARQAATSLWSRPGSMRLQLTSTPNKLEENLVRTGGIPWPVPPDRMIKFNKSKKIGTSDFLFHTI
jgi:hypothetical protein